LCLCHSRTWRFNVICHGRFMFSELRWLFIFDIGGFHGLRCLNFLFLYMTENRSNDVRIAVNLMLINLCPLHGYEVIAFFIIIHFKDMKIWYKKPLEVQVLLVGLPVY
jgi:hypothetical protein